MREVDTESPVVWPAWCYSGEGAGSETEGGSHPEPEPAATVTPAKPRAKRRSGGGGGGGGGGVTAPRSGGGGRADDARDAMNGTLDHQNNNNPVKNERLSPNNCANADNNSSSSRSGTPSSSYPGTPPAGDRGSSPSSSSSLAALPTAHHPGGHLKSMEQMMSRNYSDFMRSLAAKYNNSNPNDYFNSTRNGFSNLSDHRFAGLKQGVGGTAPFAGLISPLSTTSTSPVPTTTMTSSPAAKEGTDPDAKRQAATPSDTQQLFANFGMGFTSPNVPRPALSLFPSIDMSSTQMLLNMVRTASAQNAQQLESYLKGANKRLAEATNNPLDLSPGAAAAPPAAAPAKKSRKHQPSLSESLYGADALMPLPMLNALQKSAKDRLVSKTGSLSPKSRSSRSGGAAPTTPPLSTVAGSRLLSATAPPCLSLCSSTDADGSCANAADPNPVSGWSVDEVCAFVSSIDICAEYVSEFREQRIDGSSLSLLTEEHLTSTLGMKLGPALKLRSVLSKKLGHCAVCMHCVHCHANVASPAESLSPRRPSSTGN
nr:PREDICTED: cell wall protein RBR3 [Bemisia tabaci]